MKCERRLDDRQSECGTAALTEPHPQIYQGLEPQRLEGHGVAAFGRSMRSQHPAKRTGLEHGRSERRRCRDVAIEQNRNALSGSLDVEAGHRGNLETAQLGKQFARVRLSRVRLLRVRAAAGG